METDVDNRAFRTLTVTVIISLILSFTARNLKNGRADTEDNPEEIEDGEGGENVVGEPEQNQGKECR